MPSYIIKLSDKGEDFYLEWSTIVDAPVTYGMSLKRFEDYYKSQYGHKGMSELPDRMSRVESKGTSSYFDQSVDAVILGNRAGDGESELTKEQLIEQYCRQK